MRRGRLCVVVALASRGRAFSRAPAMSATLHHARRFRSDRRPKRREPTTSREGKPPNSVVVDDDVMVCPPAAPGGPDAAVAAAKRLPKRKVALLVGYDGSGYYGFQIQKGDGASLPTVEGELRRALEAARVVSASNAVDLGKMGWSRAARTDKGVSAARQIVAVKLEMEPNDNEQAAIDRLNAALPPKIRVFDAVRVTKNFDAKRACDRRHYAYMLPEMMLASPDAVRAAFEDVLQKDVPLKDYIQSRRDEIIQVKKARGQNKDHHQESPPHHSPEWQLTDRERRAVAVRLQSLKAAPESVERLRRVLTAYVGTKNFHNFTARIKPDDPAALRYIMSFVADDPREGWLRLTVLGQSFMLHQIRKMVAVAARAATSERPLDDDAQASALVDALCDPAMRLPLQLAPAEGLYLGEPQFASYNDYKASEAQKPRLEWLSEHPKFAEIDAFRRDVVERAILRDGSVDALLPFVDFLWQIQIFGFAIAPDDDVLPVNFDYEGEDDVVGAEILDD